jgi:esterase FrsA
VPVHIYSTNGDHARRPELIASGGVDTWRMDNHPWWMAVTQYAGVTTVAFGRGLGDGRVAHFGASFGRIFAAMSGLTGIVDAAVELAGPWRFRSPQSTCGGCGDGMHDILGNAMHWDHSPTLDELALGVRTLSRVDLLARPMSKTAEVIPLVAQWLRTQLPS